MDRLRRRTRIVASATVVLGLVTACTAKSSGDSGAAGASGASGGGGASTITLSHGYTDVEAAELLVQAKQWNKLNPKSKVNLVFNGGNDSALQKTVAGFTAGNYPDVAYEFGSSAAQLAKQPKLIDMTSKVATGAFNWDDFYPSERAAATVDGKVVGVPALVDNLSLVYNKKLFAAAGIAVPTNTWSFALPESFACAPSSKGRISGTSRANRIFPSKWRPARFGTSSWRAPRLGSVLNRCFWAITPMTSSNCFSCACSAAPAPKALPG